MKESRQYYVRRTIIMGAAAFVISVLAGIAFRGWHEYHTPLLRPFTVSELLLVSIVGPLAAGAVLAAPLTILVLIIVAIMLFFGSRSRRIWLSLAAFVLLGLYWLLMVELIRQFALID